jgi:hypothetical protein
MSRFGLITSTLLVLVVLAGCTTTGGAGGAFCDVGRPMHPTDRDVEVISDRLAGDVLAHNKTGQQACGWRP